MVTDFRLRSFYQNIFLPSIDETYSRQGISEAEKNKKNLLKPLGFLQRYVRFIKAIYIHIRCSKKKSLFFHSISCKNNGFLFTTPNIQNPYCLEKVNKKTRD